MKIARKEIKYQPKKFELIELLIATLMFMVVFLTSSAWLVYEATQTSS